MLPCSFCVKTYKERRRLNEHIKRSHPHITLPKKPESQPSSKGCTLSDLDHGYSQMHRLGNDTENISVFSCDNCSKCYKKQSDLNHHLKNSHNERQVPLKGGSMCLERGCRPNIVLANSRALENHLISVHGFECKLIEETFLTLNEFKIFKQKLEGERVCFFVKQRVKGVRTDYYCHRSGNSRRRIKDTAAGKKDKETMYWKNTSKIEATCPARLIVTCEEGIYNVYAQLQHMGHSCLVEHLQLTLEERQIIAGKIDAGIPFNRIIKDIRDSCSTKLERVHLVDSKDLSNITREFNLSRYLAHDNDAVSLELWVEEQDKLGNESPVIYYKRQGEETDSPILTDDFVLVLMTPYQRKVHPTYVDKVCIDSTHGTTLYDFQLTSLLTIDEYGAGFPLAVCLSSRVDTEIMRIFFQSIKQCMRLPYTPLVFMSDDDPLFYNAWVLTMNVPEYRLLCSWHVIKNWKKNLKKVRAGANECIKEKRKEILKCCRSLLMETDVNAFTPALDGFLLCCSSQPETTAFGNYFSAYYAVRPEQWAYAYRTGVGLTTNMYLEAYHKKIKYTYMAGKQCRRVDKCVSLLMQVMRDLMFERLIRIMKNKPTYRMQEIAKSHHKGRKIPCEDITKIGENQWLVKSSSPDRGPYTVMIAPTICDGCPLSCPACQVCVHQYACNCIDSLVRGNFCKHVHACIPPRPVSGPNSDDSKFLLCSEALISATAGAAPAASKQGVDRDKFREELQALLVQSDTMPEEHVEMFMKLIAKTSREAKAKLVSKFVIPISDRPTPSHSNLQKQPRFYSLKRKKSKKPNADEENVKKVKKD